MSASSPLSASPAPAALQKLTGRRRLGVIVASLMICIVQGCGGSSSGNNDPQPAAPAPANAPPIVTAATTSTPQDTAVTIDVGANASDADGSIALDSIRIVAAPSSGSVTVGSDGTITYTPARGFVRQDSFSVSIQDNQGATSLAVPIEVSIEPRVVAQMVSAANGADIMSADGNLTLRFPNNALANDTEISVTQLLDSQIPEVFSDLDVVAGYELAPDGATFANALNVELLLSDQLASNNGEPLLLFAQDDSGIELLDALSPQVQANGTLVTGQLSHFSRLFVVRLETIFARPVGEVAAEVGETFRASYFARAIGVDDGTRVFTGRFGAFEDTPIAQLNVFQVSNREFLISPSPVTDLAYLDDVDFTTPGETTGAGEIFGRCVNPGRAEVVVEIYSENTATPPPTLTPAVFGTRFRFPIVNLPAPGPQLVLQLSIPITCVEAEGVAGTPPTASDDAATTTPGTPVSIDVLNNDVDVDGDLNPASLAVTGGPGNGSATVNASAGFDYQPDAGFTGTDVFTYFVTDLQGNTSNLATVSVTVGIAASPPAAVDDQASTLRDTPTTIDVVSNDTDADNDLDVTSTQLVVGASNGQLRVNVDGTITYTPDVGFVGSDSFSYRVFDGTGLSSNAATVSIAVSAPDNQPPMAVDDMASTTQNQAIFVDVLSNDTDPEGDALVNLTIAQQPTMGSVTTAGRSVRYTPDNGASGTDTFLYTVDDDQGNTSNPAQVQISVGIVVGGNSPPQVLDDAVTINAGDSITIDVLANDFDPDSSIDTGSVQIEEASAQATLTINAGGTISYVPDTRFVGTDGFRYSVADTDGARSAPANVVVTAIGSGNPPIANDDVADTVPDVPVEIFVTINDSGEGTLLTVDNIVIESAPINGTAIPGIGSVLYTPLPGFIGNDTFVYSVSNATLQRDSAMVTVAVNPPVNQSPVANPDTAAVAPGELATINVLANDRDIDGQLDVTTVQVVVAPNNGSALPQPDGSISYQSDAGFIGTDSFDYQVSDNRGDPSNSATVSIEVAEFAGAGMPTTDNISAAELQFLVRFQEGFLSRGVGLFLGFNHANSESVANSVQLGDFTFLYGNINSDRAPLEPYTFDTDFQTGVATFDDDIARYVVGGFDPLPIFQGTDGQLTVSSQTDPSVRRSILAPNAPILDGDAQPVIVRNFDGLASVVQYPDNAFTHMFVRFVTAQPGRSGNLVFLSRIPREAMELDSATGMRFRAITDTQVRARLQAMNETPAGEVAVVFYNQEDTTEFFPEPGRRPVPIAAGRGISLPTDQLVEREPLNCAERAVNTRCEGGPNRRLLVANRNGDVTIHAAEDGTFIRRLIGENIPNFLVQQGRQIIQDPGTNCLLFSDTRATLPNGSRGGAIHLYDTNGVALEGSFISGTQATDNGLNRPRGMAILNGELYVATENDGRVLRFDPATGDFLGERVNDPSARIRDIEFLPGGDLVASDAGMSGSNDRLIFYPQDASVPPTTIAIDMSNPGQISTARDLNFVVSDFSVGQTRLFNRGAPNLFAVNLGTDDNGDIKRPVGVFPLDNGRFLVTGDRGIGVSVLDPDDPNNGLPNPPLVNGDSFEYISEACLNF